MERSQNPANPLFLQIHRIGFGFEAAQVWKACELVNMTMGDNITFEKILKRKYTVVIEDVESGEVGQAGLRIGLQDAH